MRLWVLLAQTEDIQAEVEKILWWHRTFGWIEDATGLPLLVLVAILLGLVLLIGGGIWLYTSRRRG